MVCLPGTVTLDVPRSYCIVDEHIGLHDRRCRRSVSATAYKASSRPSLSSLQTIMNFISLAAFAVPL